jgi:hypothetical protein
MNNSKLYYECHVTIEPVFDADLIKVGSIGEKYFFRVADLLMQKRHEDMPTRSKFDTFLTGRHMNYDVLQERMVALVKNLQECGYKIWRYKIEDTILDSKLNDGLNLLI